MWVRAIPHLWQMKALKDEIHQVEEAHATVMAKMRSDIQGSQTVQKDLNEQALALALTPNPLTLTPPGYDKTPNPNPNPRSINYNFLTLTQTQNLSNLTPTLIAWAVLREHITCNPNRLGCSRNFSANPDRWAEFV